MHDISSANKDWYWSQKWWVFASFLYYCEYETISGTRSVVLCITDMRLDKKWLVGLQHTLRVNYVCHLKTGLHWASSGPLARTRSLDTVGTEKLSYQTIFVRSSHETLTTQTTTLSLGLTTNTGNVDHFMMWKMLPLITIQIVDLKYIFET